MQKPYSGSVTTVNNSKNKTEVKPVTVSIFRAVSSLRVIISMALPILCNRKFMACKIQSDFSTNICSQQVETVHTPSPCFMP
jgi:hypothetical protein